jgi:arsenite/tail-anchored protein-transporting ATPase
MLLEQLESLPAWVFVVGKGGVGKTTVAATLAVELADSGEPVVALSTDPAHSLGDALGQPLGGELRPVAAVPRLSALEVDPELERTRFMERYGAVLRDELERGTYLAPEEVGELVDLPAPGIDELAALFRLVELSSARERLVVDTAPTGHTLRLLAAPELALRWLQAVETLGGHEAIVAAHLTRRAVPAGAGGALYELRRAVHELRDRLSDPGRCAALLVTTTEPVVTAETLHYGEALQKRGVRIAGVVVNRVREPVPVTVPAGVRSIYVPPVSPDPTGPAGLRAFARAARATPPPRAIASRAPATTGWKTRPYHFPLDRALYLVVGKGGVGKTTVASALAANVARSGREVLLLSTDPAGSLADVWGVEVGTEAVALAGEPRLRLRQLDAGLAWSRYGSSASSSLDGIAAGLLGGPVGGGGVEAVRRLLEHAPPGVDELMALAELVDHAGEAANGALVLDTAPTGHLLRLLRTPGIVLQWTHALMRLLLKYRDVVGLGGESEALLRISRRVRRLGEWLRSPESRFVVAVALPDELNAAEAERLLSELDHEGVSADVLVLNRALAADGEPAVADTTASRWLTIAGDRPTVAAPEYETGPAGLDRLARFPSDLRVLEAIRP